MAQFARRVDNYSSRLASPRGTTQCATDAVRLVAVMFRVLFSLYRLLVCIAVSAAWRNATRKRASGTLRAIKRVSSSGAAISVWRRGATI